MTALDRYTDFLQRLDAQISSIQRQRAALDEKHQKLVDLRAALMRLLTRCAKLKVGTLRDDND